MAEPVVAIGASAGGVEALQVLAAGLPSDFASPILIVLHIGNNSSSLPTLLNRAGPLQADHAIHGEEIRPGRIYVAPPDHHMLVADRRLRLARGPKENWARPAIDPLFRSVAEACRERAIGVILTGRLSDGTAGLLAIKGRGGAALVQDPADAQSPGMPQSALRHVGADHVFRLGELSSLLVRLVAERTADFAVDRDLARRRGMTP